MSSFWADVCNHANDKPMQEKFDSAAGSCGITVFPRCRRVFFVRCTFFTILSLCRLLRIA
jgi:hypothetical protein